MKDGSGYSPVPTSEAKGYADRIWEAYFAGNDDLTIQLCNEVRTEYEFMQSVWAYFSAPMRRRLKELISDQ